MLTNTMLQQRAPSIFALAPEFTLTDRYSFIPTIDVIDGLRDAGWQPAEAKQTKVRNRSNIETAKHMVRFRNPDLPAVGQDAIVPEIIMTNSHDGTAAFKFMIGLYRFVCENGLVVGDSFGNISVRHTGRTIEESIAACFELAASAPSILSEVDRFRQIELSPQLQLTFAKSAVNFAYGVHSQQVGPEDRKEIVYGGAYTRNPDAITIPVQPSHLLIPKRLEDDNPSLWTTYNKIQERLVKGGVRGRSAMGRRSTTRGVTAIQTEVKLNKALWSMAGYLADHVEAA